MPMSAPHRGPVPRRLAAISALALLSACGGGGGPGPISTPPAPSPAPTPTPSPTPTPTPSSFDTQEFRDSDGPAFHNAIAAWESGATGQGSIIAVVDSGIDSDSPEFAGRIHPASADVAGNRGIDGIDDHGTNVAMVAAAARDDTGILGIAFDAQVLAIRADDPGTCTADTPQDPSLGCLFTDSAIAAGVDLAVANGAAVINLSLGGGGASQVLLDAVARAANAGLVIVVSAGNAGDGSDPAIDPNQPDPFATSLLQAGGTNVIIVGSIDANGQLSSFSNHAGDSQASFLTARGEGICCVYKDGQLFVETINGQQFVTLFSGTSFSAPQVTGAVALLAQAFPNLTGAEIVQILLDSAADAGVSGTDALFGRGILDIARAFAPSGTTTLAGQQTALGLADRMAIASPAMGDALGGQGLATIITDKYDRAYRFDLGVGTAGSSLVPRLRGAVEQQGRSLSVGGGETVLAFRVADGPRAAGLEWSGPLQLTTDDAERARVLAARVAMRIAPGLKLGIAYAQGAQGLVAQLQGHSSAAFRIAPGTRSDTGFFQSETASLALRQELGNWGITFHAESGDARLGFAPRFEEALYRPRERYPTQGFGVALDRDFGALVATLGVSWLHEQRSILGARFHPALAQGGADSAFIDANARWQFGQRWSLGGETRLGYTRPQHGEVIVRGSGFASQAWAFDLTRSNSLAQGDTLGLRVSQPLRVESGGLSLNLPASYDYSTETAGFGVHHLSLAPHGREIVGELAWQGKLLLGSGAASLFYRHEPGHYSDQPADFGAMVSFRAGF